MLPFEAMEFMGRERREALRAEADNHRLTSPARARSRRRLAGAVSGWLLSLRPAPRTRERPADWDVPVMRPARRPT